MRLDGKLDLKSTEELLKNHKINDYGEVQKLIDRNVIRYMNPYTPMDTGALIDSASDLTTIGSGLIQQGGSKAPYGKKLYSMNANFQGSPRRGKKWFIRSMQNGGRKKILSDIKSRFGIKTEG